MSINEEEKSEVISLQQENKLTRREITERVGVSPGTVSAVKAHITMGTYADSDPEEIIDALETTFGLEKDLQKALRYNIEQLESGLKVIDQGKELTTEAGRIDIAVEDKEGNFVVIELKAGTAKPDSIAQVLSYTAALKEEKKKCVKNKIVLKYKIKKSISSF